MSFLDDLSAFRLASAAGLFLVPGTIFSLAIMSHFNLNNLQYSNTLLEVLAYVFSLAVYNAYFHPLSSFPGPRLHSASIIQYMEPPLWSIWFQASRITQKVWRSGPRPPQRVILH
jgi:hypothetical protein